MSLSRAQFMWLVYVWMRLQPLLCSLERFAGRVCLCGETNEGPPKHQQVPHSHHEQPDPGRALSPCWNHPNRCPKWAQVSCLIQREGGTNSGTLHTHTATKHEPDCLPAKAMGGGCVCKPFQGSLALWVEVFTYKSNYHTFVCFCEFKPSQTSAGAISRKTVLLSVSILYVTETKCERQIDWGIKVLSLTEVIKHSMIT